jgi:hypothetical protein
MSEFVIEYESYTGRVDVMSVWADTERDARRIFEAYRPLSEIRKIDHYDR